MIRKQVFITADQNRRLKSRASGIGEAKADIIRRGLELALAGATTVGDRRAASLIAATAEHHGLELATLNVKHFPMPEGPEGCVLSCPKAMAARRFGGDPYPSHA